MVARETFGERVRRLRKARGLTVKDLADSTGITRQYIYLIESDAGERGVNAVTLAKLAGALRVTMGQLFLGRRAA